MIMEQNIKNKIIEEYKKGKGSTLISKIVGLSKPTILKVLNNEGVVRKRDRCKSLDIKKDDKGYHVLRNCPKCNKQIKTSSKDRTIACRNHFNKLKGTNLCKPCSLQLQVGEGNPFYGKKHSKTTIKKISKNRKNKYTGNQNHMKKELYRKMSKDIMDSNWKNKILDRKKNVRTIKTNYKGR